MMMTRQTSNKIIDIEGFFYTVNLTCITLGALANAHNIDSHEATSSIQLMSEILYDAMDKYRPIYDSILSDLREMHEKESEVNE